MSLLLLPISSIGIIAQGDCTAYDADLATGYTLGTVNADLDADLLAAIECANADADADVILVPDGAVVDFETQALSDVTSITPIIDHTLTIFSDGHAVIRSTGGAPGSLFRINVPAVLTMANLTLSGGNTTGQGGAIDNFGTLTLINMRLTQNSADDGGGGLHNSTFASGLTIVNTLIVDNQTDAIGGGLYLERDATLINVTVANNQADGSDGVLGGGGGLYVDRDDTVVKLQNSIVIANLTTLSGTVGANAFVDSGARIDVTHSLYGTIVGDSSDDGGNITGQTPNFVSPTGTVGARDYRLLQGSLGVDVGSRALLPTEQDLNFDVNGDGSIATDPISIDVARNERVQDDTDAGADDDNIEMGAFEGAVTPSVQVVAFDVSPDQVLQGETTATAQLDAALPDTGLPPLDAPAQNNTGTLSIVYSQDATCDADDEIVGQQAYDFTGDSAEVTVDVRIARATLTAAALQADPASQALPYASNDIA